MALPFILMSLQIKILINIEIFEYLRYFKYFKEVLYEAN